MKTIKTGLLALLFTFTLQGVKALAPVSTFTFVDPCQRFVAVTPVAQTHNCYSFSVTNLNPADIGSYFNWNFGDGQTAHGTSVYHCYSNTLTAGQYSVTLAYSSPFCPLLQSYEVYTSTLSAGTVSDCASDASITISALSVTACCLNGGPMIPEISFVYDFGDGSGVSQTNTHTYAGCGSYIIATHMYEWTVNSVGCWAYSAVNLACNSAPTGIDEKEANGQAALFPNPVNSKLNLASVSSFKHVNVTDLMGKELISLSTEGEANVVIDVASLASGVYVLQLTSNEGAKQNLKFIRQ